MNDASPSFRRKVLDLEEMFSDEPPGLLEIRTHHREPRKSSIWGSRCALRRLGIEILKHVSEGDAEKEAKAGITVEMFAAGSPIQQLVLHTSEKLKPYPTPTALQMRFQDYLWLAIMAGFFLTFCATLVFAIIGVRAAWNAL